MSERLSLEAPANKLILYCTACAALAMAMAMGLGPADGPGSPLAASTDRVASAAASVRLVETNGHAPSALKLEGAVGGRITDIAVDSQRAVALVGRRIAVIDDVWQAPTVKWSPPLENSGRQIAVFNDSVLVVAGGHLIEADPTAAPVVVSPPRFGLTSVQNIAVSDNTLAVCSGGEPGLISVLGRHGDDAHEDEWSPRYAWPSACSGVAIEGNRLYSVVLGGLMVYELAESAPQLLGSSNALAGLPGQYGLAVSEGVVFTGSRGDIFIYDARDPTEGVPVYRHRISDSYNTIEAATADLLYISPGLRVFSLTDRLSPAPVSIAELPISTRVLSADASGEGVVVGASSGAESVMLAFDAAVADPPLHQIPLGNQWEHLWGNGDVAFAARAAASGSDRTELDVLNIGGEPRVVNALDFGDDAPGAVAFSGRRAASVDGTTLTIVDVPSAEEAQVESQLAVTGDRLAFDGTLVAVGDFVGRLPVGGTAGRLTLVEAPVREPGLEGPPEPSIVSETELPGTPLAMALSDGLLAIAVEWPGVVLYDVTDSRQPQRLGTALLPPSTIRDIGWADRYVVVEAAGDLYSIDTSSPDQPTVVGQLQGSYRLLATGGDVVWALGGTLTAVNLHDSGHMRLARSYQLRPVDLIVSRDRVIALDNGVVSYRRVQSVYLPVTVDNPRVAWSLEDGPASR